ESAEELGLIEEGTAAPEAKAVPAEPEAKPTEQAETPAAAEPKAEDLKASDTAEVTESAPESVPEAPAGDKKEE
ncbi:MAG TPA: cytochrome c1, partial [Thermodesulfobacteriota bacterium]|nr:cytochrome c1 [Thermodesulfobacteriota bacterium]